MECGLCHLPLGAMLRAFRRDHAFAQQHLRALDRALLYEIVVLHHQDFANVIGVIQKDDVVPADLVMRDVAVFSAPGAGRGGWDWQGESGGIRAKASFVENLAEIGKAPFAIPTHLVLSCGCHYNQFKRSIGFSGARRTQGRRAFLLATNLIALVKPEMTLANGGL